MSYSWVRLERRLLWLDGCRQLHTTARHHFGLTPIPGVWFSTVQNLAGAGFIALTVPEAIDAIPGVTQQRNTFNQILGVTVLIALVVIGLFFALLTVERTGLYAVLKAVGAKSSTIFMGLVVQSVVLTAVAAAVASVAVIAIDAAIPPGSIPLFVSPQRLIMSAGQLVAAAVLGCAFSLRRILRIDPATALGGS